MLFPIMRLKLNLSPTTVAKIFWLEILINTFSLAFDAAKIPSPWSDVDDLDDLTGKN